MKTRGWARIYTEAVSVSKEPRHLRTGHSRHDLLIKRLAKDNIPFVSILPPNKDFTVVLWGGGWPARLFAGVK